MEIVEGKPSDKKVVIAQEIAFAKVLSGNNKTLRDRAVKKLKKWLTIRGNGKWAFTEEEFIRIWTGLFYCMWMSDKFLVQEELAESISSLIHCFNKNQEGALLFIKCFNKRILMDWDGLDQYRIDKFNMLTRRFLRQTFVYCREKEWNAAFLRKLMGIIYHVVLHRNNSLGFVLHFINIYAEELAKVSKGKLETNTVLTLLEPFARLLARSKDDRVRAELEEFFLYLMRQTDTGIEFEEKFNAWREQGFPGEGPHCMASAKEIEQDDESEDEMSEEDENLNEVLDPRAGSVHVDLPQIPIDVTGIVDLFKKHMNSKFATPKGRKGLRCLINKFETLAQGKFPAKIKKDPIISANTKKKGRTIKNAKQLINFTHELDDQPIQTEEFEDIKRALEEEDEEEENNKETDEISEESEEDDSAEEEESSEAEIQDIEIKPKKQKKLRKKTENNKKNLKELKKNQKTGKINGLKSVENQQNKKKQKTEKNLNGNVNGVEIQQNKKMTKEIQKNVEKLNNKVNGVENHIGNQQNKKKKKRKNRKKKNIEVNGDETKTEQVNGVVKEANKETPTSKLGKKRKILSNWQVQELDTSSPEYYKIKTPKIIRLERKVNEELCDESEKTEASDEGFKENEVQVEKTPKKDVIPAFWAKATAKVNKKSGGKKKVFENPFATILNDSKSSGRRISFALEKNMAQENDQYLEEVKNSPRVPFDGTKKPIQSALKTGLTPSPINPFYSLKKIKF